jgi:ABC-type Na+ transport system ATPase subunit NatA
MKKESFSIKNIKPSMIFINEDSQSISEIVTCENDTEEYNLLKTLYNLDIQNKKEERNILDYKNLKPEEFLIQVKKVLNLYNPINESDKKKNPIIINGKELKTLESIVESYVFTADNFIKLILVLFRIQSGVPVIMMGETGCGKTSLIRIMSQLMGINMKILNIHSGVNDNDIMDFMKGKTKDNHQCLLDTEYEKRKKEDIANRQKNNELLSKLFFEIEEELTKLPNESEEDFLMRKLNERKQREQYLKNEIKEKEKIEKEIVKENEKIWVFLDEINTCDSMGLIAEMMCKHSINGIPIFKNVTFIAACNPYRTFTKKPEVSGLIAKKDKKVLNLVYTVNPLPYSLLNFVFDFGNLTEVDEKRYIESMVSNTIKKHMVII